MTQPPGVAVEHPDFQGVERTAYAWVPMESVQETTAVLPAIGPVASGATVWRPAGEDAPMPGERGWAVLAHLLAIPTFWIGPLLVLLAKGRSERVRGEAVASLNWEITVALLLALSVYLTRWGPVGPALAIAVLILSAVLHLIGAITAATGRSFKYPLAIPIVR